MTKISSLFIIVFLVFSFTGCQTIENSSSNTSEENNLNSSSQNSVVSNLDKNLSSVNNTSSDLVENLEEISTEAFEKWETLGESINFKDINTATTESLVGTYSSYLFYNDMINLDQNEIWLSTEGFDAFVNEYFGVNGKDYRENYPKGFDKEKGYAYNYLLVSSSRNEDIKSRELKDYGLTGTGEYYFTYNLVEEMEKELFPEGEHIFERETTVIFKKSEDSIQFLRATYIQNGEDLK